MYPSATKFGKTTSDPSPWRKTEAIDAANLPFLKGRSMAEVIDAKFRATRRVITDTGHPNMSMRLPLLNAHVLGQLFDLNYCATIYAGLLYGINPLDQPSVELDTHLTIDPLRGPPR